MENGKDWKINKMTRNRNQLELRQISLRIKSLSKRNVINGYPITIKSSTSNSSVIQFTFRFLNLKVFSKCTLTFDRRFFRCSSQGRPRNCGLQGRADLVCPQIRRLVRRLIPWWPPTSKALWFTGIHRKVGLLAGVRDLKECHLARSIKVFSKHQFTLSLTLKITDSHFHWVTRGRCGSRRSMAKIFQLFNNEDFNLGTL